MMQLFVLTDISNHATLRKKESMKRTMEADGKGTIRTVKKLFEHPVRVALLAGLLFLTGSRKVQAVSDQGQLLIKYKDYQGRYEAVESREDIALQGFSVIEEQIFPVLLESFGEEEVSFVPAMDPDCRRLMLFIADEDGNILYKCNQLSTNQLAAGSLEQPTEGIAAVSFQDVNRDGLTDIILITWCVNATGEYAGELYKTGDVLFQRDGGFYRDYRISDKINRFSMNKSTNCIAAFVRDGQSTEFLYTVSTLEELLENGFDITEEQCYTRNFEKLGRLQVVPGVFGMSEYDVFMIYLVNESGDIVWSFQPMEDYDNLYALKGIKGIDLDGDGMKDLVVLARYSYEDAQGKVQIESVCAIYYQRTGGFEIDTEFKDHHQCTEETTVEELVRRIREYWGWNDMAVIQQGYRKGKK